jgi:ABC-2 type transport system permease protein
VFTIVILAATLFFASNAFVPTTILLGWVKVISHLNLLNYAVDVLRTSVIAGGASTFGLGMDYAVFLLTTTVLVLIGARLYPQLGV